MAEMEYLDGPKLARWIKEVRPDWRAATNQNFERALYRWEHENAQPNYYEIDHYLIKLNIFEYEIPDDFWVEKRPHKVKKSARRIYAEKMFAEGYLRTEVRDRFKERDIWVPYTTLRKWHDKWRDEQVA